MSAITHLQKAKSMAVFVEDQAYESYGDRIVARKALARRYGWAENALRCLRYDQTKSIKIDLWNKLAQAVEDALHRQRSRIDNELKEITALRADLDLGACREAIDQATSSLEALKALVTREGGDA